MKLIDFLGKLDEDIKLPKRASKFSVGKLIGGCLYVHELYDNVLPEKVVHHINKHSGDFEYEIIKYCPKNNAVTLIQSPDFDTAPEPTVGPGLLIKGDGTIKHIKPPSDPWIYHHKWLFVKDNYPGFDVEESKERSRRWMSLDNIDYSRIGKKSFWEKNVVPRIPKSPDLPY